ncbi:EKC KEOPS complex subunit BUD32 [Lecanosticta acicola]|uniref:EKC/KEOPS complex subunit BUD32 n=1 Tax=Lecanosticta acicola TaxID=111012 RepID=A0AAI9EER3_9PEZI|nr:EKC KEOPS complex subunit BUD32 [Lecanosticta acicola]
MPATTPSEPTTAEQPRALPPPFNTSLQPFELITQGAEALLYKTTHLSPTNPAALKIRPAKKWRHPSLDKRLTRQRILAEARVLVKCKKEGVAVPAVWGVDWENGWMMGEWIEGAGTVKEVLRRRRRRAGGEEEEEEQEEVKALLRKVGAAVGKLHSIGVIHGDLTTSNMMLRGGGGNDADDGAGEIVLIDFGLATQAVQEEDRAVDLYVLERAFGSTHPREEGLFGEVLEAYGEGYKGAKATLRRLEDVRMRGRKKSMIG